ncbi:MAG: hypothetical protein J6C51_03500 [Clostridia bacterium]|nr:hypothetical protein [Clostridia bacterium]
MKKLFCVLMCAVLLLGFVGCGDETEENTVVTAVDTRIVEAVSLPREEALQVLGLTDENETGSTSSVHDVEMSWCGMMMKTEIGFFEGKFNAAIGTATFPYDADFEELGRSCLAALEEQFNMPYGYHEIDYNAYSGTEEIASADTAFAWLSETEDGGFEYRYSLTGENDGTGDNGPYVNITFMRYAQEPDNVRVIISVNNPMRMGMS